MKKLLMVLLVLGVVVISGCTSNSGGGTSSSDGIVISSFIADPSVVQGGESVFLLMDIQNIGGEVAEIKEAKIVGLPDQWDGDTGTPSGTPDELYPPEGEIEGEFATLEWELTAPESQTDIDYPAEGTIEYKYGTHVETLVRLANREWLRSLPYEQREEESEKQGTISGGTQSGPIHATIKAASSTGSRLILDIQNVGGGFAEDDKIDVSISGMDCDNLSGTVELIKGESRQFRCDPEDEPTESEQWKNIRVDVDLEYTYIVKSSVTIQVEGSLT